MGYSLTRWATTMCCFEAGTLVDTEAGLRPIEEIKVGDRVLSRDEFTDEVGYKPVTQAIGRHDRKIWKLTFSSSGEKDGKKFIASEFSTKDDHPWRTVAGDWVMTKDLRPGVEVVRARGPPARVVSVVNTGTIKPTFNLEVADFHTYFVGEERLWVHNGVCQYALIAVKDGFYPVMKRGLKEPQGGVYLNVGDVWKYGTTKNGALRYPGSFYKKWSLQFDEQFPKGSLDDALSAENGKIVNYLNQNGTLPPGNKIVR